MCYSLLVCDWSVLHIIPLCVSWLLQESAGSNTCRCRWPLPCTCCVKSSCGSRIVLASLALPSKEAYSWEQKHIQGIQSFGPRILLCVTDSFCCAYLVVQSTAVPGLDFQFSTVHIIHGKEDFCEWMLHVHVERIRIHVQQVKSRKRRNQNS